MDMIEQLNKLYSEMFDRYWPETLRYLETRHQVGYREKASYIEDYLKSLENKAQCCKFIILRDLIKGVFWHIFDDWTVVNGEFSEKEKELIFRLVICQAQDVKVTSFPGTQFGSCTLLKWYDEGKLQEYFDEGFLKETVNKAFWQMAKEYLIYETHSGLRFPESLYRIIVKHEHLLDLTRTDLWPERPLTSYCNWVWEGYTRKIEEAKASLTADQYSWLIFPLVHQPIKTSLNEENEKPIKDLLNEGFGPYKEYLGAKIFQDYFKKKLDEYFESFGETEWGYVNGGLIRELYYYLNDTDADKRSLYSDLFRKHFAKNNRIPDGLAAYEISASMFDAEVWNEVNEYFKKKVTELASGRDRGEIVPGIFTCQRAIKTGWLDKDWGVSYLQSKLLRYVNSRRYYSKPRTECLAGCLDSKLIGESLYHRVIERANNDLARAKRLKTRRS